MQRGNTTFRQDIADALSENNLGAGQFVGGFVMPTKQVTARAGEFAKLAFGRVKTKPVDDKRASGGNYNEVVHEVGSDTYTCLKRGLVEAVDDDDALVLNNYFDTEVSAADLCRYYLMLNREKRIADIAFSTTVMTSYTTAVSVKWSTAATATPVEDVDTAKEALTDQLNGMNGGGSRLIGIGNLTARRYLKATDDVKDRHYSGGNLNRQDPSDAQLAEILGLDAVYFSGLKQSDSAIWNASRFGLYIVSDSGMLKSVPQFGRVMLWRDSTPTDMMVESYRDDSRESDMIRVKHHSTEKLLTARAGHLLTNIS